MKILADTLGPFGATVTESRGFFQVITKTGVPFGGFNVPVDPMAFAGSALSGLPDTGRAVIHGLAALVELDSTIGGVNADNRLSEVGRAEKLADPRARAVKTLLGAHQIVAKNIQNLDRMEEQRYAIPPYDKTDLAGELRAREIRDFLRGLNAPTERESIIKQLGTGEDTDMLRAILRSPLNMGNIERAARLGWHNRIDETDPDGLAFLELGRRSADWAQKILGQTQAMMKPRHGFTPPQLFQRVGKDGAQFFGISAEYALAYEREMMARNAA